MFIALKGNIEVVIQEAQIQEYATAGYDVYSKDKTLHTPAKTKTISYEKHLAEIEALKAELKKLKKTKE